MKELRHERVGLAELRVALLEQRKARREGAEEVDDEDG
jgi:hypothetical protein